MSYVNHTHKKGDDSVSARHYSNTDAIYPCNRVQYDIYIFMNVAGEITQLFTTQIDPVIALSIMNNKDSTLCRPSHRVGHMVMDS